MQIHIYTITVKVCVLQNFQFFCHKKIHQIWPKNAAWYFCRPHLWELLTASNDDHQILPD